MKLIFSVLRLAGAALMLILLCACGGDKLPVSVAKIALPQFAKEEPVIPQASRVGSNVVQTATFAKGDIAVAQKYQAWLRKNGWSVISQDESVTSFNYIFGKDRTSLTLTYNSQSGVTITITRPLAEYEAANR